MDSGWLLFPPESLAPHSSPGHSKRCLIAAKAHTLLRVCLAVSTVDVFLKTESARLVCCLSLALWHRNHSRLCSSWVWLKKKKKVKLLSFLFGAIIYSPWLWLAEWGRWCRKTKQRPASKRDLALNLIVLIHSSFQSFIQHLLYVYNCFKCCSNNEQNRALSPPGLCEMG